MNKLLNNYSPGNFGVVALHIFHRSNFIVSPFVVVVVVVVVVVKSIVVLVVVKTVFDRVIIALWYCACFSCRHLVTLFSSHAQHNPLLYGKENNT